MSTLLERAGAQLAACCNQPRYRTAWILGAPLAGKSTLARQLCERYSWQYLNYTLEPGYFDLLQGRLETYQPDDLLSDLRSWVGACERPILLVDELDATLACWPVDQRRLFAHQASRLPDLPHGLVLASGLFDEATFFSLLPESDKPTYINLSGAPQ